MAVSILDNGELNFYQTYDEAQGSNNPLSFSGQIDWPRPSRGKLRS